MSTNSKANRRIFTLLVLAIAMPFIGFRISSYLEMEFWAEEWAAAVWAGAVFGSALYLSYAHRIASRQFGFNAFAPFVFLGWLGSAASVGWVANNAWYSFDSFSGFVIPDYSVRQHKNHPNHFLFKGPMEIGAANFTTEYILGAEGVDWEKPVVLEINSEGGSPQVGILIGEFIRLYNIQVEVVGKCISACTFALMSSESRYVHPRAWIGFHAAYVPLDEGERYSDPDLAFYDKWRDDRLQQLGASSDFVEKAGVRDATGGYYPSFDELNANGVTNLKKRAYLSPSELPGYL